MPNNKNHSLQGNANFRKMSFATHERMNVAITAKRMECVIPLCATISAESLSQKVVIKSISGRLWATAPNNIAFLPSFFPATASPIQAPNTI